jgi:DNA repair protein NreA
MFRKGMQNHPLFNCGSFRCPICAKAYSQLKLKSSINKENFSTEGVAPFVGKYGYPNLNLGILAPPDHENDSWLYDSPKYWAYKNFDIPKIVDFRSSLINSRDRVNIKGKNKLIGLNQELSMASKPVGLDIHLKKKPRFSMNYDSYMPPTGPQAELKKVDITENPQIHTKVQKVHYDKDLKAADALIYLYENKFDESFLSKVLSMGNFGLVNNRKLVPTRWSITATDDTLGKHLISKIKDYSLVADHTAFFGSYLGNFYLILVFPEIWSYELFEMQVSNEDRYMSDYEPYGGRKTYAKNTAGGFYSVRLAVLEKLNSMKRQGSVLALRFITGDYTLPLGVFVTREAARKCLQDRPIIFSTRELMLKYSKLLTKKKFNIDLENILKKSFLLNKIRSQLKLVDYIT